MVAMVRCQWLKSGEFDRGRSGRLARCCRWASSLVGCCDVVWLDDVDAVGVFFVLVFSFFLSCWVWRSSLCGFAELGLEFLFDV